MSGSANHGAYGNPGAQNSPWGPGSGWGQPGWDHWRAWHAARPLWIAAMVLGVHLLVAGRPRPPVRSVCGASAWDSWDVAATARGRAAGSATTGRAGGPPPPWAGWKGFWCGGERDRQPASSGNHAFDEYRAETLRRLEEEQKEFSGFLDRLRFAKDKAEFDQFMAERRNRPPATPEPPPAPPQG